MARWAAGVLEHSPTLPLWALPGTAGCRVDIGCLGRQVNSKRDAGIPLHSVSGCAFNLGAGASNTLPGTMPGSGRHSYGPLGGLGVRATIHCLFHHLLWWEALTVVHRFNTCCYRDFHLPLSRIYDLFS